MIPTRLRLRNFMCYRDSVPPLHLEGVHVACLCGENGAGKSALLDAVTWALWGVTTRTRLNDELIAIGRDEMEVELEFLVGPTRYRVVRKYARSAARRAGQSLLEFHVASGEVGAKGPPTAARGPRLGLVPAYTPITANTARDTQAKIIDVIKMDFDTFINSAFLVQGRADMFTTKNANERKEVLAKILNLGYYEKLEARAKEEMRRKREIVNALDMAVQELERELARRADLQARLREVEAGLSAAAHRLAPAQAEVEALRASRQALEARDRQAAELRKRTAAAEGDLLRLRQRLADAEKEIARLQEALTEAETVVARYQRFLEVQADKEALDAQAAVLLGLTQDAARLEQVVSAERGRLEGDERLFASKLKDLLAIIAAGDKASLDLAAAEAQLAALGAVAGEAADLRESLSAVDGEMRGLGMANLALKAGMDRIRGLMDQFTSGQGVCPLCGTPLSQDRCQDVLAGYEKEGKERAEEYRRNAARIALLKDQMSGIQRQLAAADQRLRTQQQPLQARAGSLAMTTQMGQDAHAQRPAAEAQLEAIRLRLAQRDYAQAEQGLLDGKTKAIEDMGFNTDHHFQVKQQLEYLRPWEARHRRLEEAQRRFPGERQRVDELVSDIAQRENALAEDKKLLEQLASDTRALPQLLLDLHAKERALRELSGQVDALRQDLGAAQGGLARLDQVERSLVEKRRDRSSAQEEQGVYAELAAAFGKRGVQALIIETALPEIEDEANHLLGRMTDNRMHLKLETQTAYRSREGVQETLEIKIADDLGTRSYETYSGGEAFRINVALRIALSRLLAKRAGAPLPTLFIDEGFGTQDTAGREKIVETLTAIQDEFERILVITHIDELKEQFPVRIEVSKTPTGSTFAVV